MSCVDFRIIDYNYAFENAVTITPSSEDALFPASNLRKYHRAKVWHSDGTFVIDSTNNKINFRAVLAGPELTATLTSATYTIAGLQTEIETQMTTAAGAGTFTVLYSTTTGKWTITASGVTTHLDLLFATGTDVASSTGPSIGFSVSDLTGALTYTGSAVAIHTEESIVFDLSTTEDIDSFVAVFDPSLGVNLTSGAVVRLQASATNVWTAPTVDEILTLDDDTQSFNHFFTTDQSYRYWRLKIVDPTNPDLYVELGKIFLGKALSVTRGPNNGFQFSRLDRTRIIENDFGHRYSDIYPIQNSVTVDLSYFLEADFNVLYNSFSRVGMRKPVIISMDSQGLLFDQHKMVIYGYYKQDQLYTHTVRDLLSTSISITEAF